MKKNKESIRTSKDLMVRSGKFPAARPEVPAGFKNEQGMALVLALVMIALLGMLGAFALSTSTIEMRISGNYRSAQRDYYLNDQGQEHLSTQLDDFKPGAGMLPAEHAGDCPNNDNYNVKNLPSLPSDQLICYSAIAREAQASRGSGNTAELGGGPSTSVIAVTVIGYGPNNTEFATQTARQVLR